MSTLSPLFNFRMDYKIIFLNKMVLKAAAEDLTFFSFSFNIPAFTSVISGV